MSVITQNVGYYPIYRVYPTFWKSPIVRETQNIGYTQHHWVFQVKDSILTTSKKEIISKIPQIPEREEGIRIYTQSNISTLLPDPDPNLSGPGYN